RGGFLQASPRPRGRRGHAACTELPPRCERSATRVNGPAGCREGSLEPSRSSPIFSAYAGGPVRCSAAFAACAPPMAVGNHAAPLRGAPQSPRLVTLKLTREAPCGARRLFAACAPPMAVGNHAAPLRGAPQSPRLVTLKLTREAP